MKPPYTINEKGHYVYHDKNARKYVFITESLPVLFFVWFSIFAYYSNPEKNAVAVFSFGLLAVIILLKAFYDTLKVKDFTVEISDEYVYVTIEGVRHVYPVSAFICADTSSYRMANGRRVEFLSKCELVFSSDSGTDRLELGLIELRIADSIFDTIFAIQAHSGVGLKQEKTKTLEGAAYYGVNKLTIRRETLRLSQWLCLPILIIAMGLIAGSRTSTGIDRDTIGAIVFVLLFFLVPMVVIFLIFYSAHLKARKSTILFLTYNESELKINEQSFQLSDIRAIKMNSPVETGEGPCYLQVFMKSEEKPVRFVAGVKVLPGMTEYQRSYGCSCEYPVLYETIRELCISNGVKFS